MNYYQIITNQHLKYSLQDTRNHTAVVRSILQINKVGRYSQDNEKRMCFQINNHIQNAKEINLLSSDRVTPQTKNSRDTLFQEENNNNNNMSNLIYSKRNKLLGILIIYCKRKGNQIKVMHLISRIPMDQAIIVMLKTT